MNEIKVITIVLLINAVLLFAGAWRISSLERERDRYKGSTAALLSDAKLYRFRDSLSAACVESLELTLKEYERFRGEDAALIKQLKQRNRDLSAVNKAQTQTIIELSAVPRDTVVIVRDSIRVPAVAVHCGDAWYDFDGVLTEDEFTGTLRNRDSLLLVETVRYKRFLGFLWKTKKVKDRQLDAVSSNPHTTIEDIEFTTIVK